MPNWLVIVSKRHGKYTVTAVPAADGQAADMTEDEARRMAVFITEAHEFVEAHRVNANH